MLMRQNKLTCMTERTKAEGLEEDGDATTSLENQEENPEKLEVFLHFQHGRDERGRLYFSCMTGSLDRSSPQAPSVLSLTHL